MKLPLTLLVKTNKTSSTFQNSSPSSYVRSLASPGVTKAMSYTGNSGAYCSPSLGTLFFLSFLLLLDSDAFAMKEDGMQEGLTALESILTGNLTRLAVICGSMWGAFQAYAKSSPMLLGGAVATGLGTNFLMSWAKATWAMTI